MPDNKTRGIDVNRLSRPNVASDAQPFVSKRKGVFAVLAVAFLIVAVALYFWRAPDILPAEENPGPPVVAVEPPTEYRYEAIGDSITYGEEVSFTVNELSRPKISTTVHQGWPELLGAMLSRHGEDIIVVNEGHPGDRIARVRDERIPAMVAAADADAALVMIGTIDSGFSNLTPSGIGCEGSDCQGTLKGQLLDVISILRENGRDAIHIGLIPPVWGPDSDSIYADPLGSDAERNHLIIEYNRMIVREAATQTGVQIGPDFFSCFLAPDQNRFSLFTDNLHPNALGNVVMAALWRDSISHDDVFFQAIGCPSPVYILDSLNPYLHGQKQNLLVEGDAYYTDEAFTLTSIPEELEEGIWVMQANVDRENLKAEYLRFDVGPNPVTVYIAYDPAGRPPVSNVQEFSPRDLSSELTVSDPSVEQFAIVAANEVTGTVSLGGNQTGDTEEPQQTYLVVVVP